MLAALLERQGNAAQKLELIAMLKAAGLLVFEAPEDVEAAEAALKTDCKDCTFRSSAESG